MLTILHIFKQCKMLYPGERAVDIAKRICATLYALPNARLIGAWMTSARNPLLARELTHHPRLREYIFRRYVNMHWTTEIRLEKIANHYLLLQHLTPLLNPEQGKFHDLTEIDGMSDKLRIVIDKPRWLRREGEVALSLFLGIDRIYTVMFLLSGTTNDLKIVVGNVQGDGRDRLELYKTFTKTFHGLRPRDFILHVLTMIATTLKCTEILGISDKAHRGNHWLSRAQELSVYDAMWLEHGGIKNSEDFFSLPARITRRSDAEIPTKKRALYRRRYAFLDDLQARLGQAFGHSAPAAMPAAAYLGAHTALPQAACNSANPDAGQPQRNAC
jgi:uncharacterized protein VirK/YbjX